MTERRKKQRQKIQKQKDKKNKDKKKKKKKIVLFVFLSLYCLSSCHCIVCLSVILLFAIVKNDRKKNNTMTERKTIQ
jgi:uncharacterized membrane protein